jgi:hypothetical protein
MINLRKDAENQVLDNQFKETCRDHWRGASPCPYKHNPDGTIKTINGKDVLRPGYFAEGCINE